MKLWLFPMAASLAASCAWCQTETEAPVIRRPSVGLRFEYSPTRAFETHSATASTTKPIADYTYSASSAKGKVMLSPNLEIRLTGRVSLGAEFLFHQVKYAQITEIRSGTKDPNSATDSRGVTKITETTRVNYWEIPVLARYYGLGATGLLAKSYAAGGIAFRHSGNIRTGTEYANADGTTDYKEIATKANATNQAGIVAAIGLRFTDDYRVKVTPEIRVTHWMGTSFQGPAFHAASNVFTAGLGFSF
jgi:hypothetical protein